MLRPPFRQRCRRAGAAARALGRRHPALPLALTLPVALTAGRPAWLFKLAKIDDPVETMKRVFDFFTAAWKDGLPIILTVLVLGGVLAAVKVSNGRHEGQHHLKGVALAIVGAIFAVPLIS